MEKISQPTLWNKHNFGNLTGEAFRRSEEKVRARAVSEMLDQPDGCEESMIYAFSMRNPLSRLSSALEGVFGVELSPEIISSVSVKLFNPHERAEDSSGVIPVEVSTSVVALDVYGTDFLGGGGAKVGSILLFKLSANLIDEPAPDMTAKDLAWGENCTYGAFVDGDAINYFEIAQTSGDVVQSELRRKDSTEENGQSVEMQVITPGKDRLIVNKLSPSSSEAFELEQELDKFIASRSAQ